MTHRERVRTTLGLEEPDRVPIDLGGSLASSVVEAAYPALRTELGLPVHEGSESLRYASIPEIEEDVRRALDLDIVAAPRGFGSASSIETVSDDTFIDEWGVRWHKPEKGHYYVERAPFREDATAAAVAAHAWPAPASLTNTEGAAEAVRRLREETDYAISLELRGRVMSIGQFLRGFEDWMMDLADNHAFVDALLERTTELQIAANDALLAEVGELVDIVYTSDDLGCQGGTLVSPACYAERFRPHFARIWQHIRSSTSAFLMHHCCGSVRPLIPSFIDLGVQVLNPVQVSASDMQPAELKREFGRNLAFWGAVDTREVMPRGSTADVRAEVERRIRELAPGGGYILAAVHNLQREVPPANIVEMFRAARELG